MKNQETYRIRTNVGDSSPISIPISLMQEYNSFEVLSLKINTDDTYRSYTSNEGIVVGRVSTANNGLGIPNVRVSIFVPKDAYEQSDEEAILYPFSSPTDLDGDRVRYNLLPSESDVQCYQVIGTLPTKRKILDNETVCEVFDKFYKYTTITNEAGDFMLTNIPVGKQRLHIDADLSDIGPFLSQKPYNMIENLGFDKNKFESVTQFKTSKDLDSLAQVISQNKSVYVYPYWGDATENSAEMKITRTDLSLNYEFKTHAIFMGSIITDKQSNSIRQNCTATDNAGKMSEMVTGSGRIEMIRKTIDNKIEQYKIKGDLLINDNGVWCYAIPMNLDYVRTDEFGNIIPTDNPNKGVPTRARVRFRVSLNQMQSDEDAHKRCSYLVPNNPKIDDEMFCKTNDADYSFGSDTWDESFVDLFWNKVYTVKNFVPRYQKSSRATNRKHTGVKMVNHFGDNNPFPYNNMSIKLPFIYRLICVIIEAFILLVGFLNVFISIIGALPCELASKYFKIFGTKIYLFGFVKKFIPSCIAISPEFCDDGINRIVTYPGCGKPPFKCVWKQITLPKCSKEQKEASERGEDPAKCTNSDDTLMNCVENQLAQQNEATSFNFHNDWVNGCLYMPLWYRHIKPKKSFFFGLFTRKAKDQWCAAEKNNDGRALKYLTFCAYNNGKAVSAKDYEGRTINYHIMPEGEECGDCHKTGQWFSMQNGVIVNRETMMGQKVWYYKSVELSSGLNTQMAAEYFDYEGKPMTSKLLYATDIVLLGSLNDCDINGIPKFFNYLKGSTYNMPTDVLFTDTDYQYVVTEPGVEIQQAKETSVASGCDWGNPNEYGYKDGGLFYSIECNDTTTNSASCVNLKRICELGVGLDEMQYINNINVNITSDNDDLDNSNNDYYLRPDGFVSYDDIIDFDYRSMFATMNGNDLKTKINQKNGIREYDFRHLYIDNFDGSLYGMMKDNQSRKGNANYRNNWKLERENIDYLTFRFGTKPFFYDGESLAIYDKNPNYGRKEFRFPKYKNSFYFYFGLKEGKTAIDLFNQQYNEPCSSKTEEKESIPYETKGNSWCSKDEDDGYKHTSFDGYLKINLENVVAPYSIILNSRTNVGVTYTVTKSGSDETRLTDEMICFYGNDAWKDGEIDREFGGYTKCELIYSNPNLAQEIKGCSMLNNGEYDLIIIDGEGTYHIFIVNLKSDYLQFDSAPQKFKQTNDMLSMKYNNNFLDVAKKPNDITITLGGETPFVTRKDGSFIVNGTITLYNIFYRYDFLDAFSLEVYPVDENDKDISEYKLECQIENGKITVISGDKDYLYFKNVDNVPCYVIKCPKGDVEYRVRITQLCKDNGGNLYKSVNYLEKKIRVEQPQPYKLYINSVDYDIIRNFKSGWSLSTNNNLQTRDGYGPLPFTGVGSISGIVGWDKMGNIGTDTPYVWSSDENMYGNEHDNDFDKTNGEYNIVSKYNQKLAEEPTKEEGEEAHIRWEFEIEELEKKMNILENRLNFLEKMKDAFWLFCKDETKAIVYEVVTEDSPYDLWSMYNPELLIEEENLYLSESKKSSSKDGWKFIGTNETVVSEIGMPTLTNRESEAYGNKESSTMMCFAQDNFAEGIENVNIKPPYLVACVNSEGVTKPFNLLEGDVYKSTENEFGLIKNSFGNVSGNEQKIKSDNSEFFAFHIVDKIFDYGLVCWSYINNVPKFLPYREYNSIDPKQETVNANGIVSIEIKNGGTKSDGYVEDFMDKTVFGRDVTIKTFNSDDEFTIPTRRCVLTGKPLNGKPTEDGWYITDDDGLDKLVNISNGVVVESIILPYQQYRYIVSGEISESEQYALVPNSTGSLKITDNADCTIEDTLYGDMSVALINGDSKLDKNNTLKVYCINVDTNEPITYYLLKVSKTEGKNGNSVFYPINAFENGVLKCENDLTPWDGSLGKARQFVNRNTTVGSIEGLKIGSNDNGEFAISDDSCYCVIAVTQNNCRTISPVYDFTPINYVFGLVDYGFKKTLRFAFVDVLNGDLTANNYYLTQYDFNGGYNFVGTEGGLIPIAKTPTVGTFNYKYGTQKKFIDFEDFYNNAKIGESYIEGETSPYKVWTRELGKIYNSDQDEFAANKEIDKAYEVEHGEGSWKQLTSAQKDVIILNSDLSKNFRVDLNKEYTSKIPTDKVKYQVIKFETKGENLIYDYSTYSDSEKPNKMEDTYYFASWVYTRPRGVLITVTKYFRYSSQEASSYISIKNPFDTPYFADCCEVNINDTTYGYLKNTLGLSEKDKYLSVSVRDKVGVMHQCKLREIIPTGSTLTETNEKWYDIIFKHW